jgi:hypothetical protein
MTGTDISALYREFTDLENTLKEQFAGGADVVLDYLWGQSAECLLIAGSRAGADAPIRFVQIGTAGGANITLPGAILRSTAIELKGSGVGSVPVNRIVRGIEEVLHAAVAGRFEVATKPVSLSEVERVWSSDGYMPASCSRLVSNCIWIWQTTLFCQIMPLPEWVRRKE